jgi:hypothetical protein
MHPISSFPSVKTAAYSNTCNPGDLVALSQHCKHLQSLNLAVTWKKEASTLAPAAPVTEQIAAVASLAALPQLRSLLLAVNSNAEVSALAAVSQLQQLTLFVPTSNRSTRSCTTLGLAALGLLRKLQLLDLQLPGLKLTAEEVCGIISSMQCIQSVTVCVAPGQEEYVTAGLELAVTEHIKVPATFKVTTNSKWPAFAGAKMSLAGVWPVLYWHLHAV